MRRCGMAVFSPELVGFDHHLRTLSLHLSGAGGFVAVTGVAGMGKSTLLHEFESLARLEGWRVLAESPRAGLAERLTQAYLPALEESLGISPALDPLDRLRKVITTMQSKGTGLALVIDGIARTNSGYLQELYDLLNPLVAEGLPLLVVFAVRTADLAILCEKHGCTVLEAAEHLDLCFLTRSETECALLGALSATKHSLSQETLAGAVLATRGYPLMVRLIAREIQQLCKDSSFSDLELTTTVENARAQVVALVLKPLVQSLSEGDLAFLSAMAEDSGPSRMCDIAKRLGKNPQYTGVYRNRLVESQVIRPASYGKVDFTNQHLRAYLKDEQSAQREQSANSF